MQSATVPDKAKRLRDFGVNRISMGVQSLDEPLLEGLGRITPVKWSSSRSTSCAGRFDNFEPRPDVRRFRQTMEVWRATLAECWRCGSEHLSTYEVIYETTRPLFAATAGRRI